MSQTVYEPEAKTPTAPSSPPAQTSIQQPLTPPPAPYGYGPYPVYGVPVAQPKSSNGLSVAALVCGVVGIVFAFIPFIGAPIGIVLGVLATAMGAIGRARAINKGLGTAGLVLGVLSLVVTIGWFVLAAASNQ